MPLVTRTDFAASSDKLLRFPTLAQAVLDAPQPFIADDVCPVCKGSGYLRYDVPVGDPNFGRLFMCQCKAAEVDARDAVELQRLSNLNNFRDLTFQTFNPRVPGSKDAFEAARQFANDPSGWLLLIGNYGCGKTHLAAAIANDALSKSVRLYFAIVPDLLDHLRATFDPNSEEKYDDRFEMIRNVPLLILDDLGTENAKPWAREKLYQIINHRYNGKLPTVITTNQDFDQMDGRIASRIGDQQLCRTVLVKAGDYRRLPTQDRQKLRSPNVNNNANSNANNNNGRWQPR
jgi:DNA replication protein DnaC